MTDLEFRDHVESALESLKRILIAAEDDANIEVEDHAGALHISFEDPPGKFIISPNAAVHQVWISALSTSFKLDWVNGEEDFVLAKTGENLLPLVERLVNEQTGGSIKLSRR